MKAPGCQNVSWLDVQLSVSRTRDQDGTDQKRHSVVPMTSYFPGEAVERVSKIKATMTLETLGKSFTLSSP